MLLECTGLLLGHAKLCMEGRSLWTCSYVLWWDNQVSCLLAAFSVGLVFEGDNFRVIIQCGIAGHKACSLRDIDFQDSCGVVAQLIYRTVCTFWPV